jgi:hypothetical protein
MKPTVRQRGLFAGETAQQLQEWQQRLHRECELAIDEAQKALQRAKDILAATGRQPESSDD